jgi:hypothetical protein
MRTTLDSQATTWLAAQLRWEWLLDELRRDAAGPSRPVPVERPWAA